MCCQKAGVSKNAMDGMGAGIMLIGLGVLFWIDTIDFWPWILVVVGLSGLPSSIAHKGFWAGMQGFIWMVGLAFLFAGPVDFWPGILILAGLSIMAGALFQPPALQKQKRKSKRLLEDDYR